jgi:hypothetical protein
MGINLVWDARNAGSNIMIVRTSGAKGPIKHGDFIAIHVKGGKYLSYQKRPVAVNLGWSESPAEEWQVIGGPEGEPVVVGQPFALKNKVGNVVLVFAEREFGINLRFDEDYQLVEDYSLTRTILEIGVDATIRFAESRGVPREITEPVGGAASIDTGYRAASVSAIKARSA